MSSGDPPPPPAPEPLMPLAPVGGREAIDDPVLSRQNRMRLSVVWIVPLLAIVIGAVLVARTFLKTGPDITIEFRNAEGLEPGRTEVRFKEVAVGKVTRVALRPDRQKVLVTVRLDKSVANIAVDDTRFWVVRPRIAGGGISGLGTLLSGAYIGVDAGESDQDRREFVGLDNPPLVLRGEPGRSFVLRAEDLGSLDVGAPVYHRRIPVGRVVGYALDPASGQVMVRIFIEAPNDSFVRRDTRFWAASGVELTLGASGLTVNTQSLASVIAGGIAFAAPAGAASAPAAEPGTTFRLFPGERLALAPDDGQPLRVRMLFEQSARGLEVGAPVDLLGIEVGEVRGITLQHERHGGRLPVEVVADLFPRRLGKLREQFMPQAADGQAADRTLLRRLVERGLRAQLRDGNLLTGRLYVALDFMPKAARASFDADSAVPLLPTVAGAFADMQAQLAETLQRLSKVRFDEIGAGVVETLASAAAATAALQRTLGGADTTLQQLTPEAQKTLADLRQTLGSVQQTLVSAQQTLGQAERNLLTADAPMQRQAGQTLAELQRAAQALRVLADSLQRHPESLLRGRAPDPDAARLTEPAR